MKEPLSRRLGHLASDLARIASFLDNSMNKKAVESILEESKFFIEWTAPDAPAPVQAFLSEMQSKLALCHYHILIRKEYPAEIRSLKKNAKGWSLKLLELSGLVTT
jgi:hypothetical protein